MSSLLLFVVDVSNVAFFTAVAGVPAVAGVSAVAFVLAVPNLVVFFTYRYCTVPVYNDTYWTIGLRLSDYKITTLPHSR